MPLFSKQPFMELAGALSNPEVGPRLDRLATDLAALKPNLASHTIVLRKLPLRQGWILRTIKQVLAEHPEGLQRWQVGELVEKRLERPVPKSTIGNALVKPAFERIGPGRYRLKA